MEANTDTRTTELEDKMEAKQRERLPEKEQQQKVDQENKEAERADKALNEATAVQQEDDDDGDEDCSPDKATADDYDNDRDSPVGSKEMENKAPEWADKALNEATAVQQEDDDAGDEDCSDEKATAED